MFFSRLVPEFGGHPSEGTGMLLFPLVVDTAVPFWRSRAPRFSFASLVCEVLGSDRTPGWGGGRSRTVPRRKHAPLGPVPRVHEDQMFTLPLPSSTFH